MSDTTEHHETRISIEYDLQSTRPDAEWKARHRAAIDRIRRALNEGLDLNAIEPPSPPLLPRWLAKICLKLAQAVGREIYGPVSAWYFIAMALQRLMEQSVRRVFFRMNVPHAPDFVHLWSLFGFIFPRKFRTRVYDPCVADMIQDLSEARKLAKRKWAKRWLRIVFAWRTAVLIWNCLWVGIGTRGRAAAYSLVGYFFSEPALDAARRAYAAVVGKLP